jgi:vacuolar-type H+-ATPase subunit E/Vma4
VAKREKTSLEKMSARDLVQKIRQDLRRKMEEIGVEPAEAPSTRQKREPKRRNQSTGPPLFVVHS